VPEDNTYSALDTLNFGELITAPLNACVDAQAQAATATADYIQNVGFQYDEREKSYKPVTFSFTYETNEGKKRFTIPLLSVVPVPYLQIHDVNLVFSTDLAVEKGGTLVGKVSTDDKNKTETLETSSFKSDLKINVNIKASTSDMPMGISQLLKVMQDSISVKSVTPGTSNAK